MSSSLQVTSTAACLEHRTALVYMTFRVTKDGHQALNIRTHIFWLHFSPGEGSLPSTPGILCSVLPTEAARDINPGLTMSWFGIKPVTPLPRSPSTWNTYQASLVTPKTMRRVQQDLLLRHWNLQRDHHSSRVEQIFGYWLRVARIQRWRKEATKSAREAKKLKLQDTIDTARHH